MTRILVAALALAGCYRPNVASCQYECATSGTPCPSGLECVANMCVHPGEACSDGGIVDAPADVMPCTGFGFTPKAFAIDATAYGFTVVDLDGDGKLDVVIAVDGPTLKLDYLLGDGAGSFAPLDAQILSSDEPFGVVAFALAAGGNEVVYFNTANELRGYVYGQASSTIYTANPTVTAIAVGDLNNDKQADLVSLSDATTATFQTSIGHGNGTFTSVTTAAVASGGKGVAIGDVTDDGNADIVTAGNTLQVSAGDGAGGINSVPMVINGPFSAVALGDVDSDGKLDIVVTDPTGHLETLLATGTQMTTSIGTGATGVALGDFDGDGALDAVVSVTGNVQVLLGHRDGSFTSFHTYAATMAIGVAVADLDGNGRPDVVAVDSGTNDARVLLNTCAP
jgi:hypothetical protein